jgi:hypothetical protein
MQARGCDADETAEQLSRCDARIVKQLSRMSRGPRGDNEIGIAEPCTLKVWDRVSCWGSCKGSSAMWAVQLRLRAAPCSCSTVCRRRHKRLVLPTPSMMIAVADLQELV